MTELTLSILSRAQGNNRAVLEGDIKPDGVRLQVADVPVLVHGFRRMVRGLEFDVSEMAVTTYMCAKAHGAAFTALPIFLVRGLHHGAIVRRRGSELQPGDLAGTRVGISRGYTVTTGVWARGILHRQYGVRPQSVTWVPSGDEHVEAFVPPPNVEPAIGVDLGQMVADGELAAAIGGSIAHPEVEPFFDNPIETGLRSLSLDGIYPINHCVVVRDALLTEHPWLARSLFDAFAVSKQRYVEALLDGSLDAPGTTDELYKRIAETLGSDPLPYGIEPNRATLERLMDHAQDQGILTERPGIDALFAAGTHELTG